MGNRCKSIAFHLSLFVILPKSLCELLDAKAREIALFIFVQLY